MGRQTLPQFPQPTRPAFSYDIDQVPEQGEEDQYHHPESLSLPRPETTSQSMEFSEASTGLDHDDDAAASSSSDSDRIISLSPSTGKTPKGEKEAVDELLAILVECMEELNTRSREALLRKFFSEIEKEERLEQFIVERLKQSRVKALSDLCEKLPERDSSDIGVSNSTLSHTQGQGGKLPPPVLTRSISESVEELSQKLERFKVKTLDLGGPGSVVIKEEEAKK